MKKSSRFITLIIFAAILAGGFSACGGNDAVDVDATVQAGIEGTQAAQEEVENVVNEAVTATLAAIPTPTAFVIEEMSEEEFADAVESSAEEAVQASEQASAAVEDAASDGDITEEELEDLYYFYYWTLEEIEQALYLADEYYELYDELLDMTIESLDELEEELETILNTANEVIVVLDDISQTLEQGGEAAQQALDSLNQLGQQIADNAGEVMDHLPDWKGLREQEFDQLLSNALQVSPDNIADTRLGALNQAKEYIQAVRDGISDGRFSLDELIAISQLGANAAASLSGIGAGDLAGIPDKINGLTGSFARGQLPEINLGLDSLQNSLPSIR